MQIDDARQVFSKRFLEFALADSDREIRKNFPLLTTIKSDYVQRFVLFMQSLETNTERVKYQHAYIKSALFSDIATLEDRRLSQEMRKRTLMFLPYPGDLKSTVDRLILRRKLKAVISAKLGDMVTPVGQSEWEFESSVSDWRINTEVDTGGSFHIQYSHTIYLRGNQSQQFLLHQWPIPGVCWLANAAWDLDSDADIEPAVESFNLCCSHFLKELPRLLDGLKIPPFRS